MTIIGLCIYYEYTPLYDGSIYIMTRPPLIDQQERGLYLSDIPVHDVTRELVLLNQQRIAEIDIALVSSGSVVTVTLKVTLEVRVSYKG